MTPNEETADFRKVEYLTSPSYKKAHQAFLEAPESVQARNFFNYCKEVIAEKERGHLTIREACYAMSGGPGFRFDLNSKVKQVVDEAFRLRRHPSNYKDDYQLGWANIVELIYGLQRA